MAKKKKKVISDTLENIEPILGAGNLSEETDDKFSVSSYTLNKLDGYGPDYQKFPGNISPEGYFYSPFNEITIKELEDDLQFISVRRINFDPGTASSYETTMTVYDPLTGKEDEETLYIIKLTAPVPYNVISHQPFSIYDIDSEMTYRGHLLGVTGTSMEIALQQYIDNNGLIGAKEGLNGKSQYIISLLEENAPDYAEFIPSSQRLVWRNGKKMSDLESTSPLYNMPFVNGRNYIHKNINVFVRRQDAHSEFNLFRPSNENPLRRFQVEGGEKLDFDQIEYITDTMIDAC